ncbi:MAG: acetolactate synthase, large subunit, biosynthetic type [Candidatus Margulisbacteria bacterium GWF2_35_9]|nr:MAG: acetolactate synthase, large subunit, biosynthetic type [Candidatus Margulisbacteria bacterium GWF2_35_9]
MKYNGAELLIKLLEEEGIKELAGIPGGSNLPIYDALYKSNIKHILTRHEQGAGFIAHGMTRSSGKPAVCMATSGPGATNLLTAIADAKLDSVPIIAITGQVPSTYIGTDAFQEVDTYGMSIPITKHNFLIRNIEELLWVIPEAFRIALEGRPGPVLIDIPKDIQNQTIEIKSLPKRKPRKKTRFEINQSDISQFKEMLKKSKRPLIFAGGGIIQSNASELLQTFARSKHIPVATSLMGIGCMPTDDDLYLGMIGMHGAKYTNMILAETDLLIAMGVRFGDRSTGNLSKFCPGAKIIHIDIDHSEIEKIIPESLSIRACITDFLSLMEDESIDVDRNAWVSTIQDLKTKYPLVMPAVEDKLHPINIIKQVAKLTPEDSYITTDVGQHQMWVAQAYPFKMPKSFLTSAGLGTMGFGLPTAIGAAIENPHNKIICFSGDGSILMNIQELATLADLQSNVCIIIFNNGQLGLVRQQQEHFFNSRYSASIFTTNPDFAAISKGFGVKSFRVNQASELDIALKEAISFCGPYVVEIMIKDINNVLPIVPPGAGNHEMYEGEKNDK